MSCKTVESSSLPKLLCNVEIYLGGNMFNAIVLSQTEQKATKAALQSVDASALPEEMVQVSISHSTLNYKDGLAITGRSPVVRKFPMVPGIDFAGTVIASASPDFNVGDEVILNGWGVGENHWGGLAQKASVKAEWLIRKPSGFTAHQAMAIGTAGYTAMLCVLALEERGVKPDDGPVLVTGANGGVGSIAIALLTGRGYVVHASTGRPEEAEHLRALGVKEIVDRASLNAPGKPLQKERWAAAIDSVGSHTLANVCASIKYGGTVAACGLAQGMDFPSSVAPFILRSVALIGIDSVQAPRYMREKAWERLAAELPKQVLEMNTKTVGLSEVIALAPELLDGKVRGRIVVDTQT